MTNTKETVLLIETMARKSLTDSTHNEYPTSADMDDDAEAEICRWVAENDGSNFARMFLKKFDAMEEPWRQHLFLDAVFFARFVFGCDESEKNWRDDDTLENMLGASIGPAIVEACPELIQVTKKALRNALTKR